VNCQFGGIDQRKIFIFARNNLPRLGYKARKYLMNPLVPGLTKPENGKVPKMSSSKPESKIDFFDTLKVIKQKFVRSYSVDGVVEDNVLLALLKHIIFRFLEVQNRPLVIERDQNNGGNLTFNTYEEVEKSFADGELTSKPLKATLSHEINEIIAPLRDLVTKPGLGKELYDNAYPPEVKVVVRQTAGEATFACLDVRVGTILAAVAHPSAQSLIVETIDLGESEPRTIVSGLIGFYTPDELVGRKVLIVCNLKPKNLKGIVSNGMVMAASIEVDGQKLLDLVTPQDDSNSGDRVFCEGIEGEIDEVLSPKRWTRISGNLHTDGEGFACWKELRFTTNGGHCKVTKIKSGVVS